MVWDNFALAQTEHLKFHVTWTQNQRHRTVWRVSVLFHLEPEVLGIVSLTMQSWWPKAQHHKDRCGPESSGANPTQPFIHFRTGAASQLLRGSASVPVAGFPLEYLPGLPQWSNVTRMNCIWITLLNSQSKFYDREGNQSGAKSEIFPHN